MDFPSEIYVWDDSTDTIYKAVMHGKSEETFCKYLFKGNKISSVTFMANTCFFPIVSYYTSFHRVDQKSFTTFESCLNYREQIICERIEHFTVQLSSPPRYEE